ncbi:hypothetical protein [Methylobacterium nonmethylotrophicum]|uniref:Uncharacterized protein n=1 Tax=Methylobacterium nonmethylotrophicum TaxID=1141884 RepID=A0A4Z0NR11_9HYPH|nr:hypothetical protein [Methylobacterium nonmethylotrophicum]TGD99472.1 hypothetical protein EU555_13315 [Methylobacterium nonmethylotrophicum]
MDETDITESILEKTLKTLDASNARAIALGRRYFALRQEVIQLQAEIAATREQHELLKRRPPSIISYVEAVCNVGYSSEDQVKIKRGSGISIDGWAFLADKEKSIKNISIKARSKGVEVFGNTSTHGRDDVASYHKRPDIGRCGFHSEIAPNDGFGDNVDLYVEITAHDDRIYKKVLCSVGIRD